MRMKPSRKGDQFIDFLWVELSYFCFHFLLDC